MHVIVSFIQSALWYFITTAQYRRRYDFFSLSLSSLNSWSKWNEIIHEQAFQSFIFWKCDQTNNNPIYSFIQWNLFRFLWAILLFFFAMVLFYGMTYWPFDWKYIALFRFCQFYHTNLYICWFFLVPCIICGHNSNIHRFLRLMLWYSVFVFFFLHRIFSFGSHFLRA